MKENEYEPANAVGIGKAENVIRGWKDIVDLGDFSGNPPLDRRYDE
jgi:hypothetical protein